MRSESPRTARRWSDYATSSPPCGRPSEGPAHPCPDRGEPAGKAGRVLSRKNEALVSEIAERAERLLVQLRKLTAAQDTGETP